MFIIMSAIKHLALELQREEEELWEGMLEFMEENKELFQQLAKPNNKEVIGYEE